LPLDATERLQITNEWHVWQKLPKLPKLPKPTPFPTDWLREIELSKGVQQSIITAYISMIINLTTNPKTKLIKFTYNLGLKAFILST
jgi:hypothetical protein